MMTRYTIIRDCEHMGVWCTLAYRILNYSPEQSLLKEAIITVPLAFFGGMMGRCAGKIIATEQGFSLLCMFMVAGGGMLAKTCFESSFDQNESIKSAPVADEQPSSVSNRRCENCSGSF